MSLVFQTSPRRLPTAPQPAIRLVANPTINRRVLGKATKGAVAVIGAGFIIVVILGLVLNIMISQGVYQLSGIKSQMRDLTTNNQILDEQVRSLSSDQNLANAASELGMVTNANPVYLRLADGKVIGRPQVASANSGVRIGKNVVPNAALVSVTTKEALDAATAAAALASEAAKNAAAVSQAAALHPAKSLTTKVAAESAQIGNVATSKTAASPIVLASSGIPVSPTN
jgi:Na+-transporting NADH:ubiquinone oxidoreductase subunit NqrC